MFNSSTVSSTTISAKLLCAMRENDLDQFTADFSRETLPSGQDYDLLVEAMLSERKDFVFYLLDSKCATSKPNSVNTLVHIALANGWHDVVELLLEFDVPVSTRNAKGDTAVHVAFKKEYTNGEIIDCLLGCYLLETTENIRDADGLSILHIACTRPNIEPVKKLIFKSYCEESTEKRISHDELNFQVYLDSKSPHAGFTPLHFAVLNGCTEVIKLLIHECHVNICKQDANSSTPLHLALQRRDIQAIDIILVNNAVYEDFINNDGLTHLMAACAGSMPEIATNFLNYTNLHDKEKLNSVVNSRIKDPNHTLAGYRPLHFAAEYGRAQTVQMLYFFEAMIFEKTAQDLTALLLAVRNGHHCVAHLIFNYYKAYRQLICGEIKCPPIVCELPSISSLLTSDQQL